MLRTFVRNLLLIVAAVSLAGAATGAPSTVSYQGRLTNSSGTPVADGSYSVTFSLWTDSVGGTLIWSETQNVPVSGGGLFSTQLGSIQPLGGHLIIHSDDDLFLQTAVSGTPLLPRLAVGSVPHAFASSSVSSVVPGTGSMKMSVGDDTTRIIATHESFSNLIDSYVHLSDDGGSLGLKCFGAGQPHPQSSCNSEVGDDRATNFLDLDDDADGISDVVEGMSVQPGTATLSVSSSKRRFNLMDAFPQRFVVSAHDSDTGSSVSSALETDADADGIADGGVWAKVDNTDVISVAGVDVDEDGDPDVGNSSSAKISRSILKTFFERGDKPTQSQIVDSVDENGAYHGTTRYTGSDFEGFHVSLMPDSAVVSTEVSNPDGSSSSRMRTRINELESKLQSIGLLARSSSTSSLTPDSVTEITEAQGTTTKTRRLVFVSGTTGAGSSVEVDSDGNGVPEQISEQIVNEDSVTSSNRIIQGTSRLHLNLHLYNASDNALMDMGYDGDGDGFPEQEISSSIVPTRSQHAINTKGTGAQGGLVLSAKTLTDIDSALTEVSAEDGVLSGSARLTAQPAGPTTVSVASSDASMGTPIIKGSALMSSSSSGVLHRMEWDADGDGTADRRVSEDCDDDDAGIEILAGVAIPKFINVTAQAQAPAQKADIGMVMGVGSDTTIKIGADNDEAGVTIQSGVAIPRFIEINAKSQSSAHQANAGLIMGTGPDTAIQVGCDDVSSLIRVVPPSAGTYVFDLVVTDNSGLMSMTNSLGAVSIQMDGDGRLGVGGPAHASNPIHHSSSGAHLTSGGVWTNASDENLKENFQPVDGTELLEKIDQLPISEWNYKSESDDVKHIGPTAQDFQRVFGVGENDKTISTIDPSGIALAAIKELNKKLEQENRSLRAEMDELKKLVQQLAKSK